MKKFLQAVPIPLAGIMLAFAALGNLLSDIGPVLHDIAGIVALALFIILVAKLICCPRGVYKAMQDPVAGSVACTFPMGMMLLSVYARPFVGIVAAQICWFAALLLHIALIVWFSRRFVRNFDINRVFSSWFIVYVGIVAASISSKAFGQAATVGLWAFWFGFVSLVILLALITYRYIRYPLTAEPLKPLICIYTAPVSLCLAGYIQVASHVDSSFVWGLLAVATGLFLVVLWRLPVLLRIPVYPSCAAMTFPFVITASAAKQASAYFRSQGAGIGWIDGLAGFEEMLAVLLVLYIFAKFLLLLKRSLANPS